MVCHLNVIRRNFKNMEEAPTVRALVGRLLREMQRLGTSLEVNTSGYDGIGELYPSPWMVREAVGLGIGLQLGSDSHHPSHLARGFQRAVQDVVDAVLSPPG